MMTNLARRLAALRGVMSYNGIGLAGTSVLKHMLKSVDQIGTYLNMRNFERISIPVFWGDRFVRIKVEQTYRMGFWHG